MVAKRAKDSGGRVLGVVGGDCCCDCGLRIDPWLEGGCPV